MKPADLPFYQLAQAILPEQTSGRLARMAGVNQRIAQRWLASDLEVPADVLAKVDEQRAALEKYHPGEQLALVLARAHEAGLDAEVTGAFLSAAYELLLSRRIR